MTGEVTAQHLGSMRQVGKMFEKEVRLLQRKTLQV